MNTPTTNAIEIERLIKRLGTSEFGPLTLNVPRGCFTGLIGENDAGKSTTMKLLHGTLEPSAGDIRVLGNNPATDNPVYKTRVGPAFNDLCLPKNFKFKRVGHFNRLLYGKAWHPQTLWGLAERFDLLLKRWMKKYSQDMKTKLGMVRALSHHAGLLILDEPTSRLDPTVRDDVLGVIMGLMQGEGHNMSFFSHTILDLQKAAGYVAFIYKGRLLTMEAENELSEKYALLQANAEQLVSLAPGTTLGWRHTEFDDTMLVEHDRVPAGFTLRRPNIEDIMVHLIKGEEK